MFPMLCWSFKKVFNTPLSHSQGEGRWITFTALFHRGLDEKPIHPGKETCHQVVFLSTTSWFITFRSGELLLQTFFPPFLSFWAQLHSWKCEWKCGAVRLSCFSVSRILMGTITLKELLGTFWSHFDFGLWHPSKVLRINFGSCKILVFGSCPKYFYHGFPGVVAAGSLSQKDIDCKQHWVSFFSQREKSSIRNAKFQVGDYQARYLLQKIWILNIIYDDSATLFSFSDLFFLSFIVIFIARRL